MQMNKQSSSKKYLKKTPGWLISKQELHCFFLAQCQLDVAFDPSQVQEIAGPRFICFTLVASLTPFFLPPATEDFFSPRQFFHIQLPEVSMENKSPTNLLFWLCNVEIWSQRQTELHCESEANVTVTLNLDSVINSTAITL